MTKVKLPAVRVELFKGDDDKWYFHKRGRNGKLTEASQGYTHRRSARRAALRDIPGLPIIAL